MFSSFGRGPFKSKPGLPLLHVRYEKVAKGLVEGFKVVEFRNVHTDWVCCLMEVVLGCKVNSLTGATSPFLFSVAVCGFLLGLQ